MCRIEKEILMFKIIQGAMSRERLSQPTLSGQGSIEWIIIVAVIGIALIAGLTALSGIMNTKLGEVTNTLNSVNP